MSNSAAASATVRAIGPFCQLSRSAYGDADTRPRDGLMPKRAHTAAGTRMDPPASEPCAMGVKPAATPAEAPPDEPPEVREGSQGFRAG
jgi:hypothetical protein